MVPSKAFGIAIRSLNVKRLRKHLKLLMEDPAEVNLQTFSHLTAAFGPFASVAQFGDRIADAVKLG